MNASSVQRARGEFKAKRFGFGYEKKSDNSPSTETARAEFLSLILEVKPDVISTLFNIEELFAKGNKCGEMQVNISFFPALLNFPPHL
jgi:hypothetical protein